MPAQITSHAYYIAACVFTAKYPQLSKTIQDYVQQRHHIPVVRCCVPRYRLKHFEEAMPSGIYRENWQALPDSADFKAGDRVFCLCHNCSAIVEETKPGVSSHSLWELILSDEEFVYPNYQQAEITLQDCWRARGRTEEQDAVRQILQKIGLKLRELPENRDASDFCGTSLLRPAPARNLKLAPRRFVQEAAGKFQPHTEEEQSTLMKEYCKRFTTEMVVAYCHYCTEGLEVGAVKNAHLAQLLFESEKWKQVLNAG